jgi:RND family efflux transporter MFP subunit
MNKGLIHLARTVALTALVGGCAKKTVEQKAVIRPVVTYTVQAPEAGRVRVFSGTARAGVQTPISFRVGGEIMELPARMGMQVKAGDLIAKLDPKDYELQVKQNEAQLAQAEAQFEQAKANYERTRQLYETKSVSKSELDGQDASFKSAAAQVQSALKGLELSRQQLGYCTLMAPIAGSLDQVPVEVHQTVSAGQTIAMLSAGDNIDVSIGIPEALVSRVNVGDTAQVKFDAIPDAQFTARVSEVSTAAGESRAYRSKSGLSARTNGFGPAWWPRPRFHSKVTRAIPRSRSRPWRLFHAGWAPVCLGLRGRSGNGDPPFRAGRQSYFGGAANHGRAAAR